jgi:hypothetical protein
METNQPQLNYQTKTTAYLRSLNANKRLKAKNRRASAAVLLQSQWR